MPPAASVRPLHDWIGAFQQPSERVNVSPAVEGILLSKVTHHPLQDTLIFYITFLYIMVTLHDFLCLDNTPNRILGFMQG